MTEETVQNSYPFDRVLGGYSAGGTYDDYPIEPSGAGQLVGIRFTTFLNETHAATFYAVLIGTYGNEKIVLYGATLTAGQPKTTTVPFYVRDNERAIFRIYGATAGDKQTVIVRGETQFAGPQKLAMGA